MTYIAMPYNIREPLSDPAISIADRKPTGGLRVHYCYSIALQNGGEYAENRILSSIIYGPRPHRHTVYSCTPVDNDVCKAGVVLVFDFRCFLIPLPQKQPEFDHCWLYAMWQRRSLDPRPFWPREEGSGE